MRKQYTPTPKAPVEIQKDRVLTDIQTLLIDLQTVQAWLEHEPQPAMLESALISLGYLKLNLEKHTPCITRH